MIKKFLLVLVCASAPVIGTFGIDFTLSAGAGGLLGYTFSRYTMKGDERDGGAIDSRQSMDRFNFGGLLFFDATYAELAVLIQGGVSGYRETMQEKETSNAPWTTYSDGKGSGSEMSLGFSLMGKYPFQITEKIALFPMLGIEYHIALAELRKPDGGITYDRTKGNLAEDRDKNGKSYPLSAWNSLWINLGGGIDYTIAGPWYVRGELLFGFRLPTGYENGALEFAKHQFDVASPKLAGLTGSPALKLAVGYRFFKLD